MPGLAGLFAWLVLDERPGKAQVFGYVVIVAGVAALVVSEEQSGLPSSPVGLGSLVVAAALWAVYTLRFRRGRHTPVQAAAFVCIWSSTCRSTHRRDCPGSSARRSRRSCGRRCTTACW